MGHEGQARALKGSVVNKTLLFLATIQLAQTAPNGEQPRDGIVVKALELLAPATPGPITERERFHRYLLSTYGYAPAIAAAASSGIRQWLDSPPEWGQGAAGYGKRVGNNLAYRAVRNTLSFGAATALHEDNRYFASGKQAVAARLLHALISPVVAHREGGRDSVSISSLTGIVGASLISRAWAPPSRQGAGDVGVSIGLSYAGTAGLNVFREFVPDLVRVLRGRSGGRTASLP
jgi:hypothetical protein